MPSFLANIPKGAGYLPLPAIRQISAQARLLGLLPTEIIIAGAYWNYNSIGSFRRKVDYYESYIYITMHCFILYIPSISYTAYHYLLYMRCPECKGVT